MLKHLGLSCRVVLFMLEPTYCLKQMIGICESFVEMHFIEFNPIKSQLLCFNCDTLDVRICLKGKHIPVVSHDRHLGNFISTDLLDRIYH